nr:nuclear transport factor 2 family protein [Vibrio cholerae]
MTKYQQAKRIVREYFDAIENASYENVAEVLKAHTTEGYLWRGVY